MSRRHPDQARQAARERIAGIQEQIRALDILCTGTLAKRTKRCGQAACRCARDPDARHGPYYEWGRMKRGKLVNRMVSPEQAALLRRAIANYRRARRLLRAWEDQTVHLMEADKPRK
jgi:hypothetical protein